MISDVAGLPSPWIGQLPEIQNTGSPDSLVRLLPLPWQLSSTGHVQPCSTASELPGFGVLIPRSRAERGGSCTYQDSSSQADISFPAP